MMSKINLTEKDIKQYLDERIEFWRSARDNSIGREQIIIAESYVDAFQSIRVSMFGETLSMESDEDNK